METKNFRIGKITLSPKGEYQSGTYYEKLDYVTFNGSGYICCSPTVDNPPVNKDETISEKWVLAVSKGDPGETTQEYKDLGIHIDTVAAEIADDKVLLDSKIEEANNLLAEVSNTKEYIDEQKKSFGKLAYFYISDNELYADVNEEYGIETAEINDNGELVIHFE